VTQAIRRVPPALRLWLLGGAVFLVEFGCFQFPIWQYDATIGQALWLVGAVVVPFVLSFLGLRAQVVVLPGLLAQLVSTLILTGILTAEDPLWLGYVFVTRVPLAVMLGIVLVLMYPVGKEARKTVQGTFSSSSP
jgi:hypothetical protein